MKHARKWLSPTLLALLLGAFTLTVDAALIVDRGLPDANLNDATGANRSNVAWGFIGNHIAGDDFALPALGPGNQQWRIDQISIWVVDDAFYNDFIDLFTKLSLFLGPDQGANTVVPLAATANVLAGNQTDNLNVKITPVKYPTNPEVGYEANGYSFQIWQIDFLDLGYFAPGNYLFGVDGIYEPDDQFPWFNHASNAALSGTPQDGADNLYRQFAGNAGDASITFEIPINSQEEGWDKSSDINIRVYATQVSIPEPTSLALLGLGLAGLIARHRKTRYANGLI